MSDHYPRIRTHRADGRLCLRESVSVCFYLRCSHDEISQAVKRALEKYLHAVGPGALEWYVDMDGYYEPLDEKGWQLTWGEFQAPRSAAARLSESSAGVSGYAFTYYGRPLHDPEVYVGPETVSVVAFWLPTEFLEAHGPGRVRELALDLAEELPFNSGHAGLCFSSDGTVFAHTSIRAAAFRYPGLDITDLDDAALYLGTRVKGVHWMNFLGPPVLGELGGAQGLRKRLASPGISVQAISEERAVVTLGEWPEAGDIERGLTLPRYRELARVLEPYTYCTRAPWTDFSEEDQHRWQRRFLD
jgi:hypothetical protein